MLSGKYDLDASVFLQNYMRVLEHSNIRIIDLQIKSHNELESFVLSTHDIRAKVFSINLITKHNAKVYLVVCRTKDQKQVQTCFNILNSFQPLEKK